MTAILLFALALALSASARADQLVMFRQPGCPYCARWDREVGVSYDKTDEAKILPLRQVELYGPRPPDLRSIQGIHYTPTFVVMHCGQEFARITGYIGQDQFWGLLDQSIAEIKAHPSCSK